MFYTIHLQKFFCNPFLPPPPKKKLLLIYVCAIFLKSIYHSILIFNIFSILMHNLILNINGGGRDYLGILDNLVTSILDSDSIYI